MFTIKRFLIKRRAVKLMKLLLKELFHPEKFNPKVSDLYYYNVLDCIVVIYSVGVQDYWDYKRICYLSKRDCIKLLGPVRGVEVWQKTKLLPQH